jgi:IPT/TIG domain
MKRSGRVRWIGALGLTVFVAIVATAAAAAGSSTDPTKPNRPAFSAGAAGALKATGKISPRSVPRVHKRADEDAEVDPPSQALLMRRAGITKQAPAVPLSGNATTRLRGTKKQRGGNASAFGTALEDLNSFSGATLNNTGCCEPPDTQIAVSSTRVFEPVNLTAFLFDHGGSDLGSFDLVSFMSFGAANNFGSDPKVVYDAGSDRWYMVLMVCQNAACGGNWSTMGVDLAVSQTNDPFGSWLIYQNIYSGTPFNDQGNLQDQPKLGFSGDKVTISDNVYSGHCGAGSCFLHEDVISWNKAQLFTGSANYFGWTSGFAFDSIPASPSPSSASATNTQFVTWQGFGSLGVSQITGLPGVSSVSQSTQNPGIANMTGTVDASGIPSGAASGNFIEASTWNNNHLWAASTDGCTRGSGTVDCTRLDEVDTSNSGSLSVSLDQDVGDAGAYEIYPSIAQDCIGDLYFGITYSDGSTLPSASMVASTTPGAGTYARFNYATGDTTYSGGRWGDYSGIQEDPGDCGNVWTGQEYGAVGSSGNWDTAMGQFSFDTPFISTVSPHSGPATGGTIVDITGFDFVNGGTSVNFGSTPAAVFFIDAHHLEAISPAGSGGPVNVTATTANGTSTASSAFSWVPAVTGLNPNAGPTAGGNTVDISGAGFSGATSVSFGSTAVPFTVNNDGDITATAPAHSAGTVDVTVTGPTGTSATGSSDQYTYELRPTVTSVSPTQGPAGGGNLVTVNGTNFVAGSTVKFGTTSSPLVTFVSSTRVQARAPAHTVGTVNVTVTTPGGTSLAVTADRYSFRPAPTVASLSPNAGSTAGGNTVTITGTNFVSGATVKFGTTASTTVTFVSATQLKATAPAHSAGVAPVTVHTIGGTSASGNGSLYAYGPPTVSSVSPTAGSTAGGNTVTIIGTNFVPGATVKFGTTASTTVTFVSSTQLKANAPAHAAGTVNVAVTTGGGTSATSNGSLYAYGAPAVSSVSPNAGSTAGGNTVTINGSRFVPGATVKFGTTPATAVTFVSSTQIKAKAPAHTAGTVNITVTTGGGTSATGNGSLYAYGAPSVASVSPHSGPHAGGTVVTINGHGFVPGATVKFGTTASATVTFVSGTQIKATAPAHVVGTVDIRVTTAAGTSAASVADHYTYS